MLQEVSDRYAKTGYPHHHCSLLTTHRHSEQAVLISARDSDCNRFTSSWRKTQVHDARTLRRVTYGHLSQDTIVLVQIPPFPSTRHPKRHPRRGYPWVAHALSLPTRTQIPPFHLHHQKSGGGPSKTMIIKLRRFPSSHSKVCTWYCSMLAQ